MAGVDADLLALVSRFYEAAACPDLWQDAVERVSELFRAAGAVLFVPGSQHLRPVTLAQVGRVDAGLLRASARPAGATGRFLATAPPRVDGSVSVLAVQRSSRQPRFQARHAAMLRRLTPHLARAIELGARLESVAADSEAGASLLERLATGVVLVDASARVRLANGTARETFGAADGLRVVGGRLSTCLRSSTAELHRLIEAAANGTASRGALLSLPRRAPRRPLLLIVAPPSARVPAAIAAAIAVIVFDPEQPAEAQQAVLRRLFGLTPAEATLVRLLIRGLGLDAAARRLGISRHTARNQVKSVLSKTETHRQSDLLRLILASVPGVRPERG